MLEHIIAQIPQFIELVKFFLLALACALFLVAVFGTGDR